MKSVTDVLHRTPWWALLFGGVVTLAALAAFVTPYHIIQYRDDGRSVEETRAIKREIDNTFAENAINLGRGVVKNMLARTTDPQRREELQTALDGLEEARRELREAGTEALRAKREALESARESTRVIRDAVQNAQREAERALKKGGPEAEAALKEMRKALKAAESDERAAEKAVRRAEKGSIRIGPKQGDKSMIEIEIDPAAPPVPPAASAESFVGPPAPPLPPEVASKIRRDVTGDIYRIGIGAALLLILVPLFIVAVVIKFFADRSRASQRVAELKRKEADYHRMGQQVTEAKLAALQAQVEPHFLYNTLASVQALTEVDPAKANEMTGHLIQYLRNALPKMRESVSTVGQEVELVRAYLSILQMRMGQRLTFSIAVPESLAALPFPPLMLPSLVENAIKHGLEPQREGGTVNISAELADGRLRLVVADTGRGFSETPGAGVGLANIRERLAALYGDAARLTLAANSPRGVIATIEVPADGTRSGAGAAHAAASATGSFAAPPPPGPAPATGGATPAGTAPAAAKATFWAKTWEVLVVLERIWRTALYYLFIGLVIVAGVVAIGAVVSLAMGLVPVKMGEDIIAGPAGALVAFAGGVIGFVAVAAALAIVTLVIYAVGFFVFAVVIFVAVVVLISLSPVLAPFILLGLFIWWMARRNKAAPPPPPPVTPAEAGAGR